MKQLTPYRQNEIVFKSYILGQTLVKEFFFSSKRSTPRSTPVGSKCIFYVVPLHAEIIEDNCDNKNNI